MNAPNGQIWQIDGRNNVGIARGGIKTPTTVDRVHGTLSAYNCYTQEKKAGWAGSSAGAGHKEIFGEAQSAYFDGAVVEKEV